jgi:hypothetical protein
MNNIHRIENLAIAPPRPPSWDDPPWKHRAEQIATLDDGQKLTIGRDVNGVVPVVGDYFFDGSEGREVFQLYRIARIELAAKPGLMVHSNSEKNLILESGLRIGDSELAVGHGLFSVGDYLIRKTDGYHLIPKLRFESENCDILHALRKREIARAIREREERETKSATPARAKNGRKKSRAAISAILLFALLFSTAARAQVSPTAGGNITGSWCSENAFAGDLRTEEGSTMPRTERSFGNAPFCVLLRSWASLEGNSQSLSQRKSSLAT